jgi:hypothetical protein
MNAKLHALVLLLLVVGALATAAEITNQLPRLRVENLGVPVTTMESASFTAYSRAGQAHQLLFFHPMRREMDCQVRIINLATGKVKEASGPPDRPLRMVELDGRYYLGQYGQVGLWIYDPERMAIRYVRGPDLGRLIAFAMTTSPDKKIYIGTASGDCRVLEFDPKTERWRDFGTQGPVIQGPRYVHSIATDGRFVYSAAGRNPWFLVALDPGSGEQKILLRDAKYITVHTGVGCARATVTLQDGATERNVSYPLRNGEMLEGESALCDPDAALVSPLKSMQSKLTAFAVVPADAFIVFATSDSSQLFRYDPNTKTIEPLCDVGATTKLVADGRFVYGATTTGGFIFDTESRQKTEFPCGGHIERIRGKLYSSERGVTFPKGASIFVPARLRLENGQATPDPSVGCFDMHHRDWIEPDLILDTMQPNGRFDVFWKFPDTNAWRKATARIRALPIKIERLHALPKGRLLGTTRRYQECFLYDPARNRFEVLPGKFPVSGPCIETVGGKVYLMGYPGGTFLEYDPARPWTLGDDPTKRKPPIESPESNPRMVFQFSRLDDESPSHHLVASAVGADGLIYFGGHVERKAVGGGIGWWDVQAGKPGSLRQPFLVQDCAGLAAAYDRNRIVYSSRVVDDPAGKIPTPTGAKLFVLDVKTKKLMAEHTPFPGIKSTGAIVASNQLVHGFAMTEGRWQSYTFDLDAGKLTTTRPIPFEGAPSHPCWGPDGRIWLFVGSALVTFDPSSGLFRPHGTVDEPAPFLFHGRDLYLTGQPGLRRVRNILALQPEAGPQPSKP